MGLTEGASAGRAAVTSRPRRTVKLGIVGQSVERVSFDYAVTLLTNAGAEIKIETAFSLRGPRKQTIFVDPIRPVGATELTISILHMKLADATVDQVAGSVVLIFDNCARLEGPADESYEAWTFAGDNGIKIVSQPGGGVNTWGLDL
jgi:hypothetical protein